MKDRFIATIRHVWRGDFDLNYLFLFSQRSMLHRFAIAVVVVMLAWGVREVIGPPDLGLPFLTFFPAAAISAFLGGFWSGMLAALLGVLLATYYYIPPYHELVFQFHFTTVFSVLVYLLDELIVCGAMATLHRYHLQARAQYAELHTVIQTIPAMVWLKNSDGKYLKCNPAFERLAGRSQEEIIGKGDQELFGKEVAVQLREKERAAMSASGSLAFEAWIPSAETGQPILRETVKTALRTQEGRLIGVLGIGRDITRRREMEKTIVRHQQELEQLVNERTSQVRLLNSELGELAAKAVADSQAKSVFLANMSHEIRTPLNAILGFAHLLDVARLDAEHHDYVHKILGAGRALLGIINDILDFSKIEAGRMELHHANFHLGTMLEDLSTLMAGTIGNKKIELILGVDPDLPHELRGDAQRLLQVLTNLVGNAIKFTDHGHVAVHVQRLEQDADRIVLRFSVQDTGIGIAPEVIDRLFTPFIQADISTTRRFGGTGLGLAIAKRLVELMGGQLGVRSTPGVGSEFWVIVAAEIVTEANPAVSEPGSVKVLIADDHDTQRDILVNTARSLGWQTMAVASGEAVLEQKRMLHTFDVILLDWKMPGLDGLSTSSILLSDPDCPESPIILMVTAYDQDGLRQLPEVALIDGILAKPVTPAALLKAFEDAKAKRDQCDKLAGVGQREHDSQRLAGIRILLVDDSDINLDVARRILALEGATVTTASQGQHSLDLLRATPDGFDVVLMDVQMPVMDGNETVQVIRRDMQLLSLPVIALTAGALDNERQRALASGMNDFISKPFLIDDLVKKINKLVGREYPRVSTVLVGDGVPSPPSAGSWPEIAGIDRREAYLRMSGDWSLFLSILRRMVDEFHDGVSGIRLDMPAGDLTQAAMRMHKLRGIAGNVGALTIQRLTGELENTLRNAPAEAGEQLARLDGALQELFAAAAPHLSSSCDPVQGYDPSSPVDQQAINDLLMALEQQSFNAVSLFAALAPMLIARYGAVAMEKLTNDIEGLRFHEAREQLALLNETSKH